MSNEPDGKVKRMANGGRVLDRNSAVSLGLLASLVVVAIALWTYLDKRFTALHAKLDAMDRKIYSFETQTADRWKGAQMKIWALELERANKDKDLVVPDPWEISRIED